MEAEQNKIVRSGRKPNLLIHARSEVPETLTDLISEAWQRADLSEAYEYRNHLSVVVNMERIIGQVMVIRTQAIAFDDETLFSRKRLRPYMCRVVKIKTLPDSRYLSLICDRDERDWRLRRAEVGAFIAPEPMDFTTILRQGATLDGVVNYWTRHAHVYRTANFSTAPHLDSWSRLLSTAHQNHRPEVLDQIGYFDFARAYNIDLAERRD